MYQFIVCISSQIFNKTLIKCRKFCYFVTGRSCLEPRAGLRWWQTLCAGCWWFRTCPWRWWWCWPWCSCPAPAGPDPTPPVWMLCCLWQSGWTCPQIWDLRWQLHCCQTPGCDLLEPMVTWPMAGMTGTGLRHSNWCWEVAGRSRSITHSLHISAYLLTEVAFRYVL